jgi:hypothetical protein
LRSALVKFNFGHAILTTPEFLARLPGAMPA